MNNEVSAKISNKNLIKREQFSSSFGLIATAIGSAIGLGNIWRFPYIVGQYGGGAFLLVYLLMTAIIGLPIMVSEFIIGREGRKDAINSYKKLAPGSKYYVGGITGVIAAFLILAFYGVVAGWTLEYIYLALINGFKGKTSVEIANIFTNFTSNPIRPVLYQLMVMTFTCMIVSTGVQKGVEKAAKLLIPLLVVIMLILNIYAFKLPGGEAGFTFLFKPDFSKLTKEAILAALGHSFFSLSLGVSIMITYGSYIPKDENLIKTAATISISDTVIALLAGIAIFPCVFAFGIEPSSGPGLVFISLPNIFNQMSGGYFFGILFFSLLGLAAITSTISLLETIVAFLMDNFHFQRKNASIFSTVVISIIGAIASLSNGIFSNVLIFGDTIFDFLDKLTANYFLPLTAFISVIFIGWKLNKNISINQITNNGNIKLGKILNLYFFLIKYIVPIGIILVFLFQTGRI